MAQDYAASIQGAVIRATALDATGVPAIGSSASYVMETFIRVTFTPQYDEGNEITTTTAGGQVCVDYQPNPTLKRVNIELAICEPDPEFTEIATGGTLLTNTTGTSTTLASAASAGDTTLSLTANSGAGTFSVGTGGTADIVTILSVSGSVTPFTATLAHPLGHSQSSGASVTVIAQTVGWAAPLQGVDANPNGVAIDVWSYAIQGGKKASANPYYRWLFPYVRLQPSGDRAVENDVMANVFSGWSVGNAAYGTGPDGTWAWISDRAYQYARVASAPVGQSGYVAVS